MPRVEPPARRAVDPHAAIADDPTGELRTFSHDEVLNTVSPAAAIAAVRDGFVRHHRGEWTMPPKVYLQSPPHGDFRAMPALGNGLAMLKWVTSFPRNPSAGRPVVFGTILVNDATTGEPLAMVDGRAVTALRTGAAAAVATDVLVSEGARTAGLIGCGLHGRWSALCLAALGFEDGICADLNEDAARSVADEVGWRTGTVEEAMICDVLTLVTPGRSPVVVEDQLRPGMHINALGADGPGKAEMSIDAVARCEIYVDEWAQASHGGEITGAVEAGAVAREDVTDLGAVLVGESLGRSSSDAITMFDSTGLAIQDLAITLAVLDS